MFPSLPFPSSFLLPLSFMFPFSFSLLFSFPFVSPSFNFHHPSSFLHSVFFCVFFLLIIQFLMSKKIKDGPTF